MLPKICTVVADTYGNSKILQDILNDEFINFITPNEYVPGNGYTLIYGYSLAKELFDNISIGDYRINDITRWTFNEFESIDDVYINEWINVTLDLFFKHDRKDGAYDKKSIDQQLEKIDVPFIYNGNHELYLLDIKNSVCLSWPHEEILYRTDFLSPIEFMASIINWFFDKKRFVWAFNGKNVDVANQKYNNICLFIQDIVFSSINCWVTKNTVKNMLMPRKKITTPEFMIYVSRILHLTSNDIDINDYMCRYNASIVDELFSNAKIHFSEEILIENIRRENSIGNNPSTLEKIYSTIDNLGYTRVSYVSRNKVTGRLFPSRSVFNPITTTDKKILEAITSRFENGTIAVFDFQMFEPQIISKIIGVPIPCDIHGVVGDILDCDREVAKKLNNMFFYGSSSKSITKILTDINAPNDKIARYLTLMTPIVSGISNYKKKLDTEFENNGYIKTVFGRKVWPRSRKNVFNNAIQATGADIFNSVALKIFDYLDDKASELFMHKFDSFYIDIHPKELGVIDDIIKIMKYGQNEIKFGVSVMLGQNLNELRLTQVET